MPGAGLRRDVTGKGQSTKIGPQEQNGALFVLSRVLQVLGLSTQPSILPVPARTPAQRLVKDWLLPLAAIAIIVSPIRSVVADWNDVPSGSMRPTILEGDRITVNKLAFGLRVPFSKQWLTTWGEPKRGDIVTFASPLDSTRLVKRVIAVPGDRIAMKNNRLIVNGEAIEYEIVAPSAPGLLPSGQTCDVILASEVLPVSGVGPGAGHMVTLTPGVKSVCNFPEQVIPPDCYFMMGDNRDFSSDSRMYGFVPRQNIYGKVDYVALSVDPGESYLPRWGRWFMELK